MTIETSGQQSCWLELLRSSRTRLKHKCIRRDQVKKSDADWTIKRIASKTKKLLKATTTNNQIDCLILKKWNEILRVTVDAMTSAGCRSASVSHDTKLNRENRSSRTTKPRIGYERVLDVVLIPSMREDKNNLQINKIGTLTENHKYCSLTQWLRLTACLFY